MTRVNIIRCVGAILLMFAVIVLIGREFVFLGLLLIIGGLFSLLASEKRIDTVFGKLQTLVSKKRGQDSAASSAGDAIPIVFGFCNAETVAIQVDQDPLAGAMLGVVGMARKSIGAPLDPIRLGSEIVRIAMDAGSERLLGADPFRVSVNAALWAGKKLSEDPEGKDNWFLTSDDFKHPS